MRDRVSHPSAMLLTRSGEDEPDQSLSIVTTEHLKSGEPEIILIASAPGAMASYELDEEDVRTLARFCVEWLRSVDGGRRNGVSGADTTETRNETLADLDPIAAGECQTQFGPAAEMAARARDADPARAIVPAVVGEELPVTRCPECRQAELHKMDCSRRRRG